MEMSRTEALRDWHRQAEENTLQRMEKAGLLGPEGEVVGRTIIMSRGLIDVLPSEASLAAVIARELAGVPLDFKSSTMNAFSDRMLFEDQDIFRQFAFRRTPNEDLQASREAMELLKNSPYFRAVACRRPVPARAGRQDERCAQPGARTGR